MGRSFAVGLTLSESGQDEMEERKGCLIALRACPAAGRPVSSSVRPSVSPSVSPGDASRDATAVGLFQQKSLWTFAGPVAIVVRVIAISDSIFVQVDTLQPTQIYFPAELP